LRKLSQEVLDRWQDSTGGQALTADVALDASETETVELWQWVLLILALVVIGESVLGNLHLTPRIPHQSTATTTGSSLSA